MRRIGLAVAAAVALFAAACGGGDEEPDEAATAGPDADETSAQEPVTLEVFDWQAETGKEPVIEQLIEEFMADNPNVTIERQAIPFNDYMATARLTATGDDPPDVFQVNNGWSQVGPFVEAGALVPLDEYAEQYGWFDRLSPILLKSATFEPDSSQFGAGTLYGLPSSASFVGVFYNKELLNELGVSVPATFAEFEGALQAALDADLTPIAFGNADLFPITHIAATTAAALEPAETLPQQGDWIFGDPDASIHTEGWLDAATRMQDWVDAGYFTDGFEGVDFASATEEFVSGGALFFITGTWVATTVEERLGDNAGFFLIPPADGDLPRALGSIDEPWGINAKTEHPDVAAELIDYLTGPRAAELVAETNQIPAFGAEQVEPTSPLHADILEEWARVSGTDGLQPTWAGWASPTMAENVFAWFQELLADRISADELLTRMDDNRNTFLQDR